MIVKAEDEKHTVSVHSAELFETNLLTCYMGDDGILYSESKIAERTIQNYEELFELYKKISDNGREKIRTLGNITKTQPMSKEVREFISKELPKYIKAMALLSDSSLGRMIGNFFLKVNPTQYPSMVFNDRDEAVRWLKQF